MRTKTILKKILNVEHTAIDDVVFNPDGSMSIRVHPTKGQQHRCGICGKKSSPYDNGRGWRRWRTCELVSGDGAKWIAECLKEFCPDAQLRRTAKKDPQALRCDHR